MSGGRSLSNSQSLTNLTSSAPPSWLAHSREVLTFHGYFKQAVQEKSDETYRLRKLLVLFHLENDTLQVTEKKFENSGIPQGPFLKRAKIAKSDSEWYSWRDLTIGMELPLYGRRIYLVSCDASTRRFYAGQGVELPPDQAFPVDPFEAQRTAFMQRSTGADESVYRGAMMNPMKQYVEARLGKHIRPRDQLSTFLKYDRKVLRFTAQWEDPRLRDATAAALSNSMVRRDGGGGNSGSGGRGGFGSGRSSFGGTGLGLLGGIGMGGGEGGGADGNLRRFEVHYYLTDDTVEILEVQHSNSGSDPFPKLLTRSKLPRDFRTAAVPLGASRTGDGAARRDYVHWTELRVRGCLPVYGRQLTLLGCDAFTLQWYDAAGAPQPEPLPPPPQPEPLPTVKIPPHNGFGSEEDSRQSCLQLNPKPARKDMEKLLANDKKTLRFSAVLASGRSTDAGRRFLLTFYLADDTLAVYEPAVKNSGVLGGRFLRRARYTRGRTAQGGASGGLFSATDFYVGAEVTLCQHPMVIRDVDEASLRYMEARPAQFPRSDPAAVMAAVAHRLRGPQRQESRATFLAAVSDFAAAGSRSSGSSSSQGSGRAGRGGSGNGSSSARGSGRGGGDSGSGGEVAGAGYSTVAALRAGLRALFPPSELSEHEVITLLRQLDPSRCGQVNTQEAVERLFDRERPFSASQFEAAAPATAASGNAGRRGGADDGSVGCGGGAVDPYGSTFGSTALSFGSTLGQSGTAQGQGQQTRQPLSGKTVAMMQQDMAAAQGERWAGRARRSRDVLRELRLAFTHQTGVLTQMFRMVDCSFSGTLPSAQFKAALAEAAVSVGLTLSERDVDTVFAMFFDPAAPSVDYRLFCEQLWEDTP